MIQSIKFKVLINSVVPAGEEDTETLGLVSPSVSFRVYDCLVNLGKRPLKFLMSLIQLKFEEEPNLRVQ